MTDIRERVAKAIYLDVNGRYGSKWELNETPQPWMSCADAALRECGYDELVQTLSNLLENVVFYQSITIVDQKDFEADRANAVALASSVLSRHRKGEGK